MVGSWYRTYATKNAAWIFMLPFFVFVLQRKMQGSCMSKHENKWYAKRHVRCKCMVKKWVMQTAIHEMISDKCRNDMSITMPWRDAYVMHDMNAFTNMRARKIISSYLRLRGRSAPCVQLRRWYELPASHDKRWDQHTMHAWRHDADAQKLNRGMYIAWQYPQIIIQQRHTWHLGYMHGSV